MHKNDIYIHKQEMHFLSLKTDSLVKEGERASERETDRQTDRQTETKTERQRQKQRVRSLH